MGRVTDSPGRGPQVTTGDVINEQKCLKCHDWVRGLGKVKALQRQACTRRAQVSCPRKASEAICKVLSSNVLAKYIALTKPDK